MADQYFPSVAEKRRNTFLTSLGIVGASSGSFPVKNTAEPQMNGLLSMEWEHVSIKVANSHAFVSEGVMRNRAGPSENKRSGSADLTSVFLHCSVLEPA